MQLKILKDIPDELYTCDVKEVHKVLGGPTLIHIKGKDSRPVFLSSLLHGNETTSFIVLQRLINKYKNELFPKDVILFFGNTLGASEGMRHLPGQVDYNRIWEEGDHAENKLAMDVVQYAQKANLFASIDIHNNTGKNPLYGCVNNTGENFLNLASYFGEHTVYFTEPHNVQSMAFSRFCTAITIEAGLPGEPRGIEAAYDFVEEILKVPELVGHQKYPRTEIYHTIGRMKVSPEARIDFENSSESEADLSLIPTIDSNNFTVMKKGSSLGYGKDLSLIWIEDNFGKDISGDFLKITDKGEIITRRTFIPSMFTKDIYVMKEDCLGYVMEVIFPIRGGVH